MNLVVMALLTLLLLTHGEDAQAQPNNLKITKELVDRPVSPQKFALVLGVEKYEELGEVKNALNDSIGIRNALQRFDFIRHIPNIENAETFRIALSELVSISQPAEKPTILLVYFAGHGFQYRNRNYVVPALARKDKLVEDSVQVEEILSVLKSSKMSLAVVFIDACRNIEDGGTLNEDFNQSGFQRMDGGEDSIVFLSASSGYVAYSSSTQEIYSNHSVFSGPLVEYIANESQSIPDLYDNIKAAMAREFPRRIQEPHFGSSVSSKNVYLFPGAKEVESEKLFWQRVVNSDFSWACVQEFLSRFPIGEFSWAARYIEPYAESTSIGRTKCK